MIVFYYGADSLRLREHVSATIEQFKEKRDPQGYNLFVCSADDSQKFWEVVGTAPFMAEKKMIVLSGVFASKDIDFQNELMEKIADYNVRDELVLLMFEEGDGFKSKLWKELVALPYAQEFGLLKGDVLHAWIREQVGERVTIELGACKMLAKFYADDMWSLKHAIDQIVAYVSGDGRAIISEDDVCVFLPEVVDDNTFHVLDAIHAGDGGRALQLLDDQWKAGKSVVEVVGLLLWQWRVLLRVKGLLDREPDFRGKDVARELSMHAFVADKSCRLVRDVDTSVLREQYQCLIEIDEMAKSGGAADAALTRFVFG